MPLMATQSAAAKVAINQSGGAPKFNEEPGSPGPEFTRASLRKSITREVHGESEFDEEKAPAKLISDEEYDEVLAGHGVQEQNDKQKVVKLVERNEFDMAIGAVIALNALVMGFECDYKKEGTDMTPWIFLDNVFCLVWIAEMVLKLYYLRFGYFWNPWNIMDFLLVLLSVNDAWIMPFIEADGLDALGVIRMVRILRILRLLRLLRLMKMFKNLWLIIVGFTESLSTLYWVLMLMSLVVYIFGVFIRSTLSCEEQFAEWADCSDFFGSIPATMYTLFQIITLESWSQVIARPVLKIQPWFFLMFLMFLFLTTFGMLNIIVGVIVENTLNAAKQNQDLQDKRAQKRLRKELEALKIVFEEADADGSGTLELEEFEEIIKAPTVKTTLANMEIPIDNPSTLFDILDEEGSGSITFSSFTAGVFRIKGPPTGMDMKGMQVQVTGIVKRLSTLEGTLSELRQTAVRNERFNRLIMDKLGIVQPPDVVDVSPSRTNGRSNSKQASEASHESESSFSLRQQAAFHEGCSPRAPESKQAPNMPGSVDTAEDSN